jgi:DNA-binding NtrC family response regulator
LVGCILLVASDSDTGERWETEIRRGGHEVLLAITWREAFRRIVQGGIDAVVIDTFDPRLGYEQLARSTRGRPDAPPIVLVSSAPSAAALAAEIGGSVYLPKPCESSAVLELISQLVGETTHDFKKEDPTAELPLTS